MGSFCGFIFIGTFTENVTERVLKGLSPSLSGKERHEQVESRIKALIAECESDKAYRCSVPAFHRGGEYYRIIPEGTLKNFDGLKITANPDLEGLVELGDSVLPEWQHELDQVVMRGMPFVNEVVFFHKASNTLIMTDVLQCWSGKLPWNASLYARLTDVRSRLDVPRTVRLVTRSRMLAAGSARTVLQWPFTRVITAHNAIVEHDAHRLVERAFRRFGA